MGQEITFQGSQLPRWVEPYSVGGAPTPDKGAVQEAAVPQQASPELDPDDAEDEEDEEAEQKDIPKHGQCVQQQSDQDPHA